MSQLFIHAYLDEDVDVLVARLVASRGFQATVTVEAGQGGRSDDEQLQFAADRGMCIITHNRSDFEPLASAYYAAGRNHAGIIIAVRRRPQEIARRLLQLMDDLSAEEMVNQVRYI